MKKVAITIVVLIAFIIKSNAQEELSYGPMVGISMTSFTEYLAPMVSDYAFGYQVGGVVNYRIIELVGASFSASYSKMGGKDMDPTLLYAPGSSFIQNISKLDVTMHTIDLNLTANVYLPLSLGSINPKVILGVANAYNLKATAGNERDFGVESSNTVDDVTDRFTYYDFALIGGVGVETKILDRLTSIDIRYRAGMTDINNVGLKPEMRHSSIALVISYNFN